MRDRFSHHALTNLSSNMMANCVLASHHSRGGIFHVCATWRKTRYSNLIAASSVGKWPLVRTARRSLAFKDSMAFVGVNDAPHSDGKGEERDDMLPVAPPALRDCRILAAPDAGVEILQRPAGHVRIRRRRMRRLAKAHRSNRNDHLHRNARLGSPRSAAMTLGIICKDVSKVPSLPPRTTCM